MTLPLLVIGLCVWGVAGLAPMARCVDGAYRLDLFTTSPNTDDFGWRFVVLSWEKKGRTIWVRTGHQWTGDEATTRHDWMEGQRLVIESALLDRRLIELGEEGRAMPKLRRYVPRSLKSREHRFELDESDSGEWLEGPLTIRLSPFLPITVRLADRNPIEIRSLDAGDSNIDDSFSMIPAAEGVASFSLRMTGLRMGDDRLKLSWMSKNQSRHDMRWIGRLGLGEMRAVTEEGEVFEPVEVDGAIAESLGPQDQAWLAGSEYEGSITFPLPHSHTGGALTLLMPGYQPLSLVRGPDGVGIVAAHRAAAENEAALLAVQRLQGEERLFESLAAFWRLQGKRLQRRDEEGYLRGFSQARGARAQHERWFADLGRVPISWLEFVVPTDQSIEGDDTAISNLRVEMRYLLAGLPRDNEFLVSMRCDLSRLGSGHSWQVKACLVEGREPFWMHGLHQMLVTPHFVIFYKGEDRSTSQRARQSAEQLEQGRANLHTTPLRLQERHAALVIPDGEDFKVLTGRDPSTFSGAASAAYVVRDGKLRVVNQMLFLNDSNLRRFDQRCGTQDQQKTIQHELVHLALGQETRPWTPAWLVEGVATYFAGQLNRSTVQSLRRILPAEPQLKRISMMGALGAGDEEAQDVWRDYQFSAAVVGSLIQQFGERKVLELYKAFKVETPVGWHRVGPGQEEMGAATLRWKRQRLDYTDRVMKKVLGDWDMEQAEQMSREWLRK